MYLSRGKSSVDGQHGARHPFGFVGRKKDRCARHVLWRAHAWPRSEVMEELVGFLVFQERANHGGCEEPRADCVDVDALWCEVERKFARQVDDSALRCAVGRLERQADQTSD